MSFHNKTETKLLAVGLGQIHYFNVLFTPLFLAVSMHLFCRLACWWYSGWYFFGSSGCDSPLSLGEVTFLEEVSLCLLTRDSCSRYSLSDGGLARGRRSQVEVHPCTSEWEERFCYNEEEKRVCLKLSWWWLFGRVLWQRCSLLVKTAVMSNLYVFEIDQNKPIYFLSLHSSCCQSSLRADGWLTWTWVPRGPVSSWKEFNWKEVANFK